MKKLIPLLVLLAGCAHVSSEPLKTSNFCTILDDKAGFTRCETVEVVCYNGQCFGKPPKKAEAPNKETKK